MSPFRATPKMEAAGKEPGRNLANKLLNEAGKPPRCCVVKMVSNMRVDNCCTPCANVCASHLQIWMPSWGSLRHYDCAASIRMPCLWCKKRSQFVYQPMVLRALKLWHARAFWAQSSSMLATFAKLRSCIDKSLILGWKLLVLSTNPRSGLWVSWPLPYPRTVLKKLDCIARF